MSRAPRWLCWVVVLGACGRGEGDDAGRELAAAEADPVQHVLDTAERLYAEARFDSASALWSDALPSLAGSDREPVVLTSLGLAARNRGKYAEARHFLEEALRLKLARGLEVELPRAHNALGLLAWDEGRLGDAAGHFAASRAAARQVGNERYLASTSNNLGLVQLDRGRFREAAESFESARDMFRRQGDPRLEARAILNLAVVDLWLDDPAGALSRLEEARALHSSSSDPVAEIEALGQMGVALAAMGDLRAGFLALDSALELSRRHGLREEEASNLEMLGDLYSASGDSRRALDSYRDAASIYEAMGAPLEVADLLRSEASLRRQDGQYDAARTQLMSALDLHVAAGAALEAVDDLLSLAELAAEVGAPGEAEERLSDASERARQASPATLDRVRLSRARVADRLGRAGDVVRALDSLVVRADRMRPAAAAEVHGLRARAFARGGQLDSAVIAGRLAVATIEGIRRRIGSEILRTSYLSRMNAVYGDLVLALLRQDLVEEAFEVADGARGRALLEHLGAVRDSSRLQLGELAEGELLLRRINELLERLGELDEARDPTRDGASTAAESELLTELAEARGAYESALLRFAHRRPQEAAVLGVRKVSADQIRASLGGEEAIAEYLVLDDRLLAFVFTSGGIRIFESLVPRTQLASRVRLARSLLQDTAATRTELLPVLSGLHRLLMEPARQDGALDGIRRLVIVPHGPLNYLPFAALVDSQGRVVGEQYAVSMLPTAAALRAPETGARVRSAQARAIALAPFPERLPATAVEARFVETLDPPGEALVGHAATEGALRAALADDRVVHVASHALMNARNPLFSRVELRAGSRRGEDDGRLEVHELLGIRSHSPFVFLSGCETGLGAAWSTGFEPADDYATLAQAFLYAGVGTVVATLWRIEDEGAAAFARRFYHHVRVMPVPDAVSAAQGDLRRSGRFTHPYYWAGYVVAGANRPATSALSSETPSTLSAGDG